MTKDTAKLLEELKQCADFKKFYNENNEILKDSSLSDYLNRIIEKKKLKKSEIIRKAEISEVYAYQIFSGTRRKPERNKLLCLAFGMALNLDETQELLKISGYSQLYVKKPFDSIIIYAICNRLSVMETNNLLYEYEMETIG